MFDLLHPGQRQSGAGVAVHEQAPQLGEEPGVRFVSADDLHAERPEVVLGQDHRRSAGLVLVEAGVARRDAEQRECRDDIGNGRAHPR